MDGDKVIINANGTWHVENSSIKKIEFESTKTAQVSSIETSTKPAGTPYKSSSTLEDKDVVSVKSRTPDSLIVEESLEDFIKSSAISKPSPEVPTTSEFELKGLNMEMTNTPAVPPAEEQGATAKTTKRSTSKKAATTTEKEPVKKPTTKKPTTKKSTATAATKKPAATKKSAATKKPAAPKGFSLKGSAKKDTQKTKLEEPTPISEPAPVESAPSGNNANSFGFSKLEEYESKLESQPPTEEVENFSTEKRVSPVESNSFKTLSSKDSPQIEEKTEDSTARDKLGPTEDFHTLEAKKKDFQSISESGIASPPSAAESAKAEPQEIKTMDFGNDNDLSKEQSLPESEQPSTLSKVTSFNIVSLEALVGNYRFDSDELEGSISSVITDWLRRCMKYNGRASGLLYECQRIPGLKVFSIIGDSRESYIYMTLGHIDKISVAKLSTSTGQFTDGSKEIQSQGTVALVKGRFAAEINYFGYQATIL